MADKTAHNAGSDTRSQRTCPPNLHLSARNLWSYSCNNDTPNTNLLSYQAWLMGDNSDEMKINH